jgi:hypothetical protein
MLLNTCITLLCALRLHSRHKPCQQLCVQFEPRSLDQRQPRLAWTAQWVSSISNHVIVVITVLSLSCTVTSGYITIGTCPFVRNVRPWQCVSGSPSCSVACTRGGSVRHRITTETYHVVAAAEWVALAEKGPRTHGAELPAVAGATHATRHYMVHCRAGLPMRHSSIPRFNMLDKSRAAATARHHLA